MVVVAGQPPAGPPENKWAVVGAGVEQEQPHFSMRQTFRLEPSPLLLAWVVQVVPAIPVPLREGPEPAAETPRLEFMLWLVVAVEARAESPANLV